MNLERHLRVLWNHKLVVVIGLIAGTLLAFLAAFQISTDGLTRRGSEVWSSSSQVMVTQQGFPWGRVTLPANDLPGEEPSGPAAEGENGIQFADPTRFANLALLYSVISYSDQVRARLPEKPTAGQIQAIPLDPTNSGSAFLPIISLTTQADTPEKAVSLNRHTFEGLQNLLVSEQEASNIPQKNRVLLSQLNKPQAPVLVEGRSMTSSILAFLLCSIAAVALAHILEGLRVARRRREADDWDQVDAGWSDLDESAERDLAVVLVPGGQNGRDAQDDNGDRSRSQGRTAP
jgi:hypothetical protein